MAMIDIRTGATSSLSPYFEAGTAVPFIYAYRNEGTKYTASGFVGNLAANINGSGNILVQQGAAGVQGFTQYQANVETIQI